MCGRSSRVKRDDAKALHPLGYPAVSYTHLDVYKRQLQTGAAICQNFYKELGMDVGSIQQGYILRTGLLMLLIALGGGIATVLVGLLASKIAAGVARALRRDTFNKVESFSNPEFDRFSTACLLYTSRCV